MLPGDIYFFLSISSSFVTELFCAEDFEPDLTLSATLFPIKSPISYAVFWIACSEGVLNASVPDCLAWSRNFWLYLMLKFLLIFSTIFLAKDKNPSSFTNTWSLSWTKQRATFYGILWLMT